MKAVLIGAGGLGCAAGLAIAEAAHAAGLPLELLLVDDDVVERSNLARQILYGDAQVGQRKAVAAAARLGQLVRAGAAVARFDEETAAGLLAGAHVVLDGSDNARTRFVANDAALAAGVPLVHGAALGGRGQLLSVLPGASACLRCLFEGPPSGPEPRCAEAGVLGPLCGLVGAAMAAEALALLEGRSAGAAGTLVCWDAFAGAERRVPVPLDPGCRCSALVAGVQRRAARADLTPAASTV